MIHKRTRSSLLLITLLLLGLAGCKGKTKLPQAVADPEDELPTPNEIATETARAQGVSPNFKKVLFIIFENTNYQTALAQPFFSKMAKAGALLKNFHAETHPSQFNYIALISGSTHDLPSNNTAINLSARHVGNLLEAQGMTWKVYAESYLGGCFLGDQSGTYVRKHEPFISFTDIQRDPAKCGRIVEASHLQSDIQNGTLADYSLYVPDLNNDGHDTGPAYADRWLAKTFGALFQDPRFMQGMLIVLTFDESGPSNPTNHIYTVLFGDSVNAGSVSVKRYDHYSLLRMVEDTFKLGTLGLNDASATPISGVWK